MYILPVNQVFLSIYHMNPDQFHRDCGYNIPTVNCIYFTHRNPFLPCFVDDGGCTYVDVEIEISDCYGNSETESLNSYNYCCKSGENCNRENIDTSDCTRSTAYEKFFKN